MWSIFRVINSSDEEVDLCSSVECKVNFEGFIPQCETLIMVIELSGVQFGLKSYV